MTIAVTDGLTEKSILLAFFVFSQGLQTFSRLLLMLKEDSSQCHNFWAPQVVTASLLYLLFQNQLTNQNIDPDLLHKQPVYLNFFITF